jgi:methylmalonyl-CoA mutase C-terminal domain/subunit
MQKRLIRVVIAKLGLDGHNRGAQLICAGLRNEGYEVIYTGIRQKAKSTAQAVLQEDADAVGVSSMVGAHLYIMESLVSEMNKLGLDDVVLFVGGIIPKGDDEALRKLGVRGIFRPGTRIKEIAEFLRRECHERE